MASANPSYKEVLMDGEPEEPQPNNSGRPNPDFTTSRSLKEEEERGKEKKEKKKEVGKDEKNEEGQDTLKTTLIISGVIVAVIGAIFAITKKIREA